MYTLRWRTTQDRYESVSNFFTLLKLIQMVQENNSVVQYYIVGYLPTAFFEYDIVYHTKWVEKFGNY